MDLSIIEIDASHIAWPGFLEMVDSLEEGEMKWVTLQEPHYLSSHILVAFVGGLSVGYLRFCVQRLGEAEGRPPVIFESKVLYEAKVVAFGVLPAWQGQGVGRCLQEAGMARARELGCYQFRSRSEYRYSANHHLKISLGFGIQPSLEDDSLYFVLAL